jgi:catechol 2,3-dioxygenase-like lactoylglutathione lyase family enzyme
MSETKALISAVRSVVVRVRSVAESRPFYEQGLGLTCTGVEECAAAAVGLSGGTARVAQFAQAGEPYGMIELVEWSAGTGEPIRDPHRPLDFGWFTNNLLTHDMQRALPQITQFGARAVSEPKSYLATRRITETMIDTPTGERCTLIQAGDATDAPHPFGQALATMGVIVPDYDAALAFYRDALGLAVAFAMEHTGAPFDALVGAPAGTRLRMALLTSDGNWTGKYEILEMTPPAGHAPARDASPRADGARNGYWLVSAYATDLDAVRANVGSAALARGPVDIERPGTGRVRLMVVRAPGGELLELIERKA